MKLAVWSLERIVQRAGMEKPGRARPAQWEQEIFKGKDRSFPLPLNEEYFVSGIRKPLTRE
jgi:hypothetical protein